MSGYIKRGLLIVFGIIFLLLGLAGLALPFLQGFLFLIIGSILLSIASPSVRAWTEQHTRKFPKIHRVVEKTEKRITDFIGL